MNDKDKQEFEKWFLEYPSWRVTMSRHEACEKAWSAALEYERFHHKYCVVSSLDKLCEKLEAQNKKLREALQFYADATNNPKQYMRQGYLVYNLKKAISVDGGTIAREALKEVGEL